MVSTIQLHIKVTTDTEKKLSDVERLLMKEPDMHDQNINNEEGNLTIQSFPKVTTDAEKKPSDVERPLMKKPDTHDQNINNEKGNSKLKKIQFYVCLLVLIVSIIIIILFLPRVQSMYSRNTPEKNFAGKDKNYTLIQWTGGESSIPKCFSVYDECYLKSNKTGVSRITFLFQFSYTPDVHIFLIKVYLKRDNKSLLLGSSWKRTKGPTKIWFILTDVKIHTNDQLYVLTNSPRYMKNNRVSFSFV